MPHLKSLQLPREATYRLHREELRGPRFAVNLRGSEYITPSDWVWLQGAIKTRPMGPEKTIAALRDYIAAFLGAPRISD